jgi:hypothetical protein
MIEYMEVEIAKGQNPKPLISDKNPTGRYYSGGAWSRPITERHECTDTMAKCQEIELQWQSANKMKL